MAPRLPRKSRPAESPPPIGDNSDAVEEGQRVQFLSIISKYDGALADLEVAQGPVRAARKQLSSIKGLAKAAGIPAWRLEQRYEEMQRPAFENADNIAAEARERRWAGIITPEQLKMHTAKDTPDEVRDAVDWRSAGYKAGVLGRAATLPEGMPTRYTQDFLGGHEDGRKSYLLTLAEAVPKPKGASAQQIAEQAAREFKQDNPEVDLDAEAKKLKGSKFMERSAPDDGFEISEEERAAQKPRQAIVEVREAAEEEPAL